MYKEKIILTLFILAFALVSYGAPSGYSISMYSYPNAIIADGKSTSNITCEIYDNKGNKIQDGVRVDFSTSLGNITPYANTSGGSVQIVLRSAPVEGVAIVTATVPSLGIVSRTTIDFLAPGTEIVKDSYLSIEGKYLGYDADSGIIDSTSGINIKYKGAAITAYDAQIDTAKNVLLVRAKLGEYLTLKKQDTTIEATELYVNLTNSKAYGYILVDGHLTLVSLRINDLRYEPIDNLPNNINFDFVPIEEINDSSLFITAKLFILEPKKEIKAKRPTVYVKGTKTFTVPFLKMSLYGGVGGVFGSFVAYGSDGLRIDLPIYVNLTATSSTAIRVQKDAETYVGSSSGGGFWRVDLESAYGTGTDSSGMFEVMNVNQKDGWGLRLNNRTIFSDSGRFQGSIEYPNHENVFTNLNYSKNLKDFYYSISGRSSYYEAKRDTYSGNAYIQTQAKPLFKFLNYNVSNQVFYDASYTDKKNRLGDRAGLNIYTNYINLGAVQLNASGSYTQTFQNEYGGYSVTGNAGVIIPMGQSTMLSLYYSYLLEEAKERYESSYVSADLYFWLSSVGFRANGTYNINDESYNVYGEFQWSPIRYWALKASGSYQHYNYDSYYDYKLSIGRQFGIQEYRIAWTYSKQRFDFEVGTIGF